MLSDFSERKMLDLGRHLYHLQNMDSISEHKHKICWFVTAKPGKIKVVVRIMLYSCNGTASYLCFLGPSVRLSCARPNCDDFPSSHTSQIPK